MRTMAAATDRGEETFVSLFSHESQALANALAQTGASNCGETAVLTCLRALGLGPSPKADVVVRERYHGRELCRYLQARSVAGATGQDLADGALSSGQAVARFVPCGPDPPSGLGAFLAKWTEEGAASILTLNTQLDGADAWHHQPCLAVRPRSSRGQAEVLLGNPVEWVAERDAARLMGSPSVLAVRAEDVRHRLVSDGELESMDAHPDWARMKVSTQVRAVKAHHDEDKPLPRFVFIPAAYVPGVTLIALKGSPAASALVSAELPGVGV